MKYCTVYFAVEFQMLLYGRPKPISIGIVLK